MLKHLHLENFKAFGRRVQIPLAPITLIFGENSAGKSSILQALNLLKQTSESREPEALLLPRSDRELVDLGSFQELLFDHNLKRTLKMRVGFEHDKRERAIEFQFARHSLEDEVRLVQLEIYFEELDSGDEPALRFETVQIRDRKGSDSQFQKSLDGSAKYDRKLRRSFSMLRCVHVTKHEQFWSPFFARAQSFHNELFRDNALELMQQEDLKKVPEQARQQIKEALDFYKSEFDLDEFVAWMRQRVLNRQIELNILPMRGRSRGLRSFLSPFPLDDLDDVGEEVAEDVGSALDDVLESLFPLRPYRKPPSRWYIFTGTSPHSVGYDGEHLPDLLHRNKELVDAVNVWLKRLGIEYKLSVSHVGAQLNDLIEIRLQDLRRARRNVSVSLIDVGFGISQILPFIVESLADEPRIISIEQPEVHIHPRLQADLGDLLAESIEGPNGKQFIIETHSEHLVLRLQRLVRQGKLQKENLFIIYVSHGEEGSQVQRLRLDEEGYFMDDWPGGFFPERLREVL